jgi:uncharacterized surface protein with fasciclin (FAS1) repeats
MRDRWRRAGVVAAIVALAVVAAACGEDEPSGGNGAAAAGDGAAAMEPFGTGCAAVPTSGDGSFESMMTQPVATAAASNPELTSLAMDLDLAGLTDTLNNADGVTVFAPTNAAFAAAADADPEGTEMMMDDPTGEFADLLSYHVVEGQIPPDELAGEHTTLQGSTLMVQGSGEDFKVDGMANVVCGDIHTDNATVYVIDEVLHP